MSNQIHFSTLFAAGNLEHLPASHCQAKQRMINKNMLFDRDLLPEQNSYDVQFYGIDVNIDPDTETIQGAVEILIKSREDDLTEIILDAADHLIIDMINSENLISYRHINGRLALEYNLPIFAGEEKSIEINYHGGTGTGVPWEGGLVYPNNQVYSLNCPYGLSAWVPCKDHPSDKANEMDIRITLPVAYDVASNGVLLEVVNNEDGTRTHNWHENYPIATYLFNISASAPFFVSTEYYHYSDSDSMPIIYYTTSQWVPSGFHFVEDALPLFSDLFGLYPFVDEKYAINKVNSSGWAMEHQNNVTTATTSGMTQVHVLGHQWFGDKVTVRDWQHGWHNEGFATYCEALYKENIVSETSYHSYMNYIKWSWNDNESVFTMDTIGVWDIFDIIIYYKGAWVNHMLRHVVGDSTYFTGLRDYLEIYAFANVVTEDFQAVMEAHHGADLNWFFDEWIYGNGHPFYQFDWAAGNDRVKLKIIQQATGTYPDLFTMLLDIRLTNGEEAEQTETIWLEHEITELIFNMDFFTTFVEFDPDNWVLSVQSGTNVGLLGDFNQDQFVDILDVILVIKHILEPMELSELQQFLSDLDYDGLVNIQDLLSIISIILAPQL